jgi:predicted transcriptional regulator
MSTTTLKLSPQLKKRVASLVRGTEKSAHAFMVEAIAREAERAELRRKFIEEALAADREMERTGLAYDFDDVKEYFESKLSGQRARRPRLKRWRK